jgi:asparagine synthase (glutamine-hydrolysing)
MCGISGIITTKQASIDLSVLENAALIMQHRWPDASHTWVSPQWYIWLGHVRLSIVDLDHRSDQPFIIDDGDFVMTFNGEIYNYTTLRQRLEGEHHVQFVTTSDTEVLLYLYKFYWTACLQLIQGMFAFCIYDKKANHCFLARDFVGQKPLVYAQYEDAFYFASEIPALLHSVHAYPKL